MRMGIPACLARRGPARPARALALPIALGLALAAAAPARAAVRVPPLTGPVVDEAGLLDAASRRRLEELAYAARAGVGDQRVQLQVLIVRSLEGEPIEDFSIRVAEAWKVGTKGKDNGVLVTVASEDRAVRIEVGGGLEGGLTDVQSSRIIRGTIVPAFREGRFGQGLYDAEVQILGALGALPSGVHPVRQPRGVTRLPSLGIIGLFVVFFVVRTLLGFGPRRRRSLWWGGGPWIGGGGGGFGGGGGGGGGWSGGGGGFSGGGASGRW